MLTAPFVPVVVSFVRRTSAVHGMVYHAGTKAVEVGRLDFIVARDRGLHAGFKAPVKLLVECYCLGYSKKRRVLATTAATAFARLQLAQLFFVATLCVHVEEQR